MSARESTGQPKDNYIPAPCSGRGYGDYTTTADMQAASSPNQGDLGMNASKQDHGQNPHPPSFREADKFGPRLIIVEGNVQ
jgi:hypothetical protein